MKEAPQQLLIVLDRRQLGDHTPVKFARIPRCIVAQPGILQPTPHGFHRAELGRVRREPLQAQSIRQDILQLSDRVPFVHAAAVPDDHDAPAQLPQQRLEECGRIPGIEVVVDQRPGEQTQAIPPRCQPHRGGDRDLLTPPAVLDQLRRLTPQGPGATDQRGHHQAALVDQGEVGPLAPGLSLMRGHSVRSHSAITSGSCRRATRWGFWGVNPRARSQEQRYRALRRMPNSCRINWARRGPVHNSVSNPCSVGFSLNQRRTIFSWVGEIWGGWPETGLARNPSSPDCRKRANQRRTDRGSTSRNSATSSVEYPSRMRRTARNLRCSSSSGEPGFLIQPSVRGHGCGGHYFSDSLYLLYSLTVTGDGAVPVQFRVQGGNTTDDRSHRETWDFLRRLTGRADFLYVADCKLATTENMAYLHRNGGRFLSVLPRTRNEDAAFRAAVRAGEVAWRHIHDKFDDHGDLVDRFSIGT